MHRASVQGVNKAIAGHDLFTIYTQAEVSVPVRNMKRPGQREVQAKSRRRAKVSAGGRAVGFLPLLAENERRAGVGINF